ncbi:N-acetylmuramoyl-L-alanine amidase [Ruminococcaceae bacterium OttesenSCG-928-N02]|nr:N-acetylmuramoyl-L-alanine amidase [Ruminococcaceae bacterium OttesenSCG-928-N02]
MAKRHKRQPGFGARGPRRLYYIIGVGFLLLLAFLIGRRFFRGDELDRLPSDPEPYYVMGVPVYSSFLPVGSPARAGTQRTVEMIVIHETANTSAHANAQAHAQYLLSGEGGSTAWHYTVDENEIYQHIPDDEVAYHAGDGMQPGGGNIGGIGIELCINYGCDFDAVMDNAARLTAELLFLHKLTTQDIVQHYDCSGKNCPAHMRGTGLYDTFMGLVQTYYELRCAPEYGQER